MTLQPNPAAPVPDMELLRGCNAADERVLARDMALLGQSGPAWGEARPTQTVRAAPSRAIRVLHVLAPGREGGLEQVVAMLAAGRQEGDVHVAAVVSPGDTQRHPFIDRLLALGVPCTPVVVSGRSYLAEYRGLDALLRRLRPAIVHTHGYRADILAGAVAHARGVRTVSTVHGFTGGGARNRFYEQLQCYALRRADAVVAVSKPLVRRLAMSGISTSRIHCVPNGFSPTGALLTRNAARTQLGLPHEVRMAGWVGRLSREKGADVMLKALALPYSNWALSIIGTGREQGRLMELARELGVSGRVYWLGAIPGAASLLAAFDAFVLSSRTEGTPISLLEAMYAGTPVIATCVGGVPDVVTSEQALLVPAESPNAIAEALADIARDHAGAARRAESARKRVVQSFGSASWLAAVDAIYGVACA